MDELKVVYQGQEMSQYDHIQAGYRYLQPCDTKNEEANKKNIQATIDYILAHPEWKLSLQTQKILDTQRKNYVEKSFQHICGKLY